MNIYWTGPRESDMAYTGNMFAGSFTFYGSNTGTNRAYCNTDNIRINHNLFSQAASDFILSCQLECIERDPDCRFMAYNPNCVYGAPEEITKRTLCLNDAHIMRQLDNKIAFREIADGVVPVLPMQTLQGQICSYSNLKRLFPGFTSFVIQEPVSSGGQGTFLMNESESHEVFETLQKDASYIVTGYLNKNIPVNLHAIIYDSDIVLFPGSVQIIQHGNHRLLYRGADYKTFLNISSRIRDNLYNSSLLLLQRIQKMGYRGIVGIDAIISEEGVFFSEINNRFQGSSILLAKALNENGLKSLAQMNLSAFSGQKEDADLLSKVKDIIVPYSMFNYVYESGDVHSRYIFEKAKNEKRVAEVLGEGYIPGQNIEPYASEFSLLFDGNILSICSGESAVRIHPNIPVPDYCFEEKMLSGDLSSLKIALINRGITISPQAQSFIRQNGDARIGNYYSLDLFLRGIYINTPLRTKFVALSPFEIDMVPEHGLALNYYGNFVTEVDYDSKNIFPRERNIPVDQILFLSTDRLRIQNNSYCTFAKNGVPCKFCEATNLCNDFTEEDVIRSIEALFTSKNCPHFRHILVGGLSNDIGAEKDVIIHICNKIREYTDMPIYLMCLPPKKDDIAEYYAAGVNEFGFNIEVFDRSIAENVMPGKGRIPLSRYLDALQYAVQLSGADGQVKTAFVLGLEPLESLLNGVETVCRMGVAPILSVFRPIPNTEMEDVVPPSDTWLYEATIRAEEICRKYGLSLGPTCPACRNNTLTIAKDGEVKSIYSYRWRRNR